MGQPVYIYIYIYIYIYVYKIHYNSTFPHTATEPLSRIGLLSSMLGSEPVCSEKKFVVIFLSVCEKCEVVTDINPYSANVENMVSS